MSKINDRTPDENGLSGAAIHHTSPPRIGSAALWRSVEAEVDAFPAEEATPVRIDLQVAAETATLVCNDVTDDAAFVARFMAVCATGECDPDCLSKVQRYAGAAWYARHRQQLAESGHSEALVPQGTMEKAEEVYGRMSALAQYNFATHPEEGSVVASLSSRGHRPLANSLVALAELYARHADRVASDPVNYKSTDARDARRLAAEIVDALSTQHVDDHACWTTRCAAVWTLLSRAYAEVQSLGRWLLRRTPEVAAERFPSLVAESRVAMTPRKAATPDATPPATPGAVTAAPTPAAATTKRKRRGR